MSLAVLRPLKEKQKRKKMHYRFYKSKYNINRVIDHYPTIPRYAYQVSFLVQWSNGNSTTVEFWKRNKSLHNNSVVLQYMLSNEHLQQFVPDDVNFRKTQVAFKRKFPPN